MHLTWLGWAGAELRESGDTVVIDALEDAGAVFAPIEAAAGTAVPPVVRPTAGAAVAGLVTHLHRDHADAAAIAAALAPGAPVFEPPAIGGEALENLALAQAEHEFTAAGFDRRAVACWQQVTAGPFTLTALPASDGIGDPQTAWLVEAGGVRVLHLGDTMFHGAWWRIALRHGPFDAVLVPVNGAVLDFPHRQPASPLAGALDPEQAALAAARFAEAAARRGVPARVLEPGETIELERVEAAARDPAA